MARHRKKSSHSRLIAPGFVLAASASVSMTPVFTGVALASPPTLLANWATATSTRLRSGGILKDGLDTFPAPTMSAWRRT